MSVIPLSESHTFKFLVPPGEGGVADYAHQLASVFMPLATVTTLSRGDRLDVTRGGKVLLQYSGYGYAKRGAPLWLLPELNKLKKAG